MAALIDAEGLEYFVGACRCTSAAVVSSDWAPPGSPIMLGDFAAGPTAEHARCGPREHGQSVDRAYAGVLIGDRAACPPADRGTAPTRRTAFLLGWGGMSQTARGPCVGDTLADGSD